MNERQKLGQLREAVKNELVLLWSDLEEAKRQAYNGRWSVRCDHLLIRIQQHTKLVGPAPWPHMPLSLLEDGSYQRLHYEMGLPVKVDMDRVAQARAQLGPDSLAEAKKASERRLESTCPAPCPPGCDSCARDRDCECYQHQHLADKRESRRPFCPACEIEHEPPLHYDRGTV